jgi:catecholate siderophore receptor
MTKIPRIAAIGVLLSPITAHADQVQTQIPTISITGTPDATPALSRLTEPVLNTPQTIKEIPAQQALDQGATSIEDVTRYVPELSLHANEDNSFGYQPYIRGFSSEGDVYIDGMVNVGKFSLDPFDMQRGEVIVGPSGVLFGRGSTGGVFNYVSKTPQLDPFANLSASFGTDGTRRATADLDQVIDGVAYRVNLLTHDAGVADRDKVQFDRFGIAPSVAFGLGTDQRLILSFLHQSEYDTPDYGIPWLDIHNAAVLAPVPRNSFYGFSDDFVRANVDQFTAEYERDLNDMVTIRDQFRYGSYTRAWRYTEPVVANLLPPGTDLSTLDVQRSMLGGRSWETFLDNQSEAHLHFQTFGYDNRAVAGIEIGRQTTTPTLYKYSNVPGASLFDPDSDLSFTGTQAVKKQTDVVALTQAAYVIDTLQLSDQWLLNASARLDRFDASVYQSIPSYFAGKHTDVIPTWRAAITYKPESDASLYFAYGTSFDPSAEALSLSAATALLAAEQSRTYEVGAKWELADLLLSGAVFRTEILNYRESDPTDPSLDILAGDARVDGVDLAVTGKILPGWQVFGGYTYLQTAIVSSPNASGPNADLGNRLQNAPKHSAKLWTTYDVMPDVTIGGGIQYIGNRTVSTTPDSYGNLQLVPSYWTIDLMARYRLTENLSAQVNLKNLNDAYGYDGVDNNHVVPLAGRSALFTILANF